MEFLAEFLEEFLEEYLVAFLKEFLAQKVEGFSEKLLDVSLRVCRRNS